MSVRLHLRAGSSFQRYLKRISIVLAGIRRGLEEPAGPSVDEVVLPEITALIAAEKPVK
jgi:hypothetical protein